MAPHRVDPAAFREAIGLLPTGVTVVTAFGEAGPSGATANAVCSLSLEPMLMLACLDRGSRTLRSVQSAGRFGINVLSSGHETLARQFSTKVAEPAKWDGVEWVERDAIPALAEALVWVGCELHDVLMGGDHVIVTGAVAAIELGEGDPLVFHGGEYRPLGG
jgi:3-hydroxy-9,10-secoandrosta-1,3,5(10)-triene-9,17-dione monooxygenase reductase component